MAFRLLIFFTVFAISVSAAPLQIARNGQSEYSIALPENPSVVDNTAAKELQNHLHKVIVISHRLKGLKASQAEGNMLISAR